MSRRISPPKKQPPTVTQPTSTARVAEPDRRPPNNQTAPADPSASEPVVQDGDIINIRPPWRVDPNKRTRDAVAIVGFTDHRKRALALDPEQFELWGLNELYRYMPAERFSRWFEIHPRPELERSDDGRKHLADLARLDIPIYMHQHFADIPASVPFPRQDLERVLASEYFTSTPAWMIGMAIAMGFREIHVYGVDMAQDTEYAQQRPCCEFWLGYAMSRGIKVVLPDTSDLLASVGQYGFGREGSAFAAKLEERVRFLHERDNALLAELRRRDAEHQQVVAQFEQAKQRLLAERNQILGAIQDCNFWRRSWAVSGDSSRNPVPDRSKDPATGITPQDGPQKAAAQQGG